MNKLLFGREFNKGNDGIVLVDENFGKKFYFWNSNRRMIVLVDENFDIFRQKPVERKTGIVLSMKTFRTFRY